MRDQLVEAYVEVQERLSSTLAASPPEQWEAVVPATPEWTVRQLLAHLVGGPVDLTGDGAPEVDGLDAREAWRDPSVHAAVDAMTARQVAEREGRGVPQLLQEWQAVLPAWTEVLRGERPASHTSTPFVEVVTVGDAIVHEDDLHRALGVDPPAESPALALGVALYSRALDVRLRALALPGVRLVSELGERVAGQEVQCTLRAPARTLLRVLTYRLSGDEVRSLDWDGDPAPVLPTLGAYRPPADVPAQPGRPAPARQPAG